MLFISPALAINGIINQDLQLNLFSESWGLLFTLFFFIMIFDLREFLEWKRVETKVSKRIGREINLIFMNLKDLCKVSTGLQGNSPDLESWKELCNRQLEQMTKQEIVLEFGKELLEKGELAKDYAPFIQSRNNGLSIVEGKYLRFLSPEIQESLMEIEQELDEIYFTLNWSALSGANDYKKLSKSISEIMKQIVKIRENGIDIGF
jgi:hypothetical protein